VLVRLDRESDVPLYQQIRTKLREMILSGLLPPGSRLPPSRELARQLGVNRSTVVNAYRALWSEGLVEGRAGGGTVIARPQDGRSRSVPQPVPLLWEELFTERVPPPGHWTDQAMPKVEGDVIRFDWGSPPPDLFPLETMREVATQVLDQGPDPLRYGPAEGVPVLRELIAQRLRLAGMDIAPSQVLILTGSEQGIYMVAQALLRPGDGVVVEAPTYPGALRTFRSLGAQLHPVPLDKEGMRLDVLEGVLAYQRPKLIYTVPTFQNPTGITMSLDRRRGLLELAWRYRVPILEDDPYSDLRYEGQHIPLIQALDRRNYVIYLSTFSKWLFPGLRVGWMVAPRGVASRLVGIKRSLDLCTSPLSQFIVFELIRRGVDHLDRILRIYRARRDALLSALDRHCRGFMEWGRPQGGFFVWCTLREGIQMEALQEEALRAGVAFISGKPFFLEGFDGERHLRLNFPRLPEGRIEEGIQRLALALRQAASRPEPKVEKAGELGTPPVV